MAQAHAWESAFSSDSEAPAVRHAAPLAGHPWDRDSSSSSGSDIEEKSDPADKLIDFCVDLYLVRNLTARELCIIMHWCSEAGIQKTKPLAFRPDAPSGHYQRHLEIALPFLEAEKDSLYEFDLPSYDRDTDKLAKHTFSMIPFQETIEKTFAESPSMKLQLAEAVAAKELPPSYFDNPVVLSGEDKPLPVSLFIDAVPYSQTDSVIGFWIVNAITKVGHLIGALRKHMACGCGCRGWDSFYVVFVFILWCFRSLALGIFPTSRHDGKPWQTSDSKRTQLAGKPMSVRACLLF